ncbi:hypothetical protein [Bradyrhizobium sp.]|uniref:hypothetical protein n=1 Tax=Bradyrhizobium sp. TaxID=376 RepID=UPI003C321578
MTVEKSRLAVVSICSQTRRGAGAIRPYWRLDQAVIFLLRDFQPFDRLEGESSVKHFRFQIRHVFVPRRRLADTKSWLQAKRFHFIVCNERSTRAKMHRGKALIREP